ncbi:hypothetical protein [Vibrio intestinalis]|uniref:hypothetical protein n=1 Tax=Vibrio intestinalis TaxID=2933291 RepID=UPI0021A85FDA|nr:hypothetical protein [Vibrio intestinalis]
MLRFSLVGLVITSCLSSPVVFAKGERYGAGVSQLTLESHDYDYGSSGEQNALRYSLVHTRPIDEDNNRWRWWLGLSYLSESVPAPNRGVYEEVSNLELRAVPQYALGSWSIFTPYIGGGVSLGYSQYSNRWKVDAGGYRFEQLEDKQDFEVGAVVAIGSVIKLGSNPDAHLQIVPQISYTLPLVNDGIKGIELSVSLLF